MYPSKTQVELASKEQLGRWLRSLPSPGWDASSRGRDNFKIVERENRTILNRVIERFQEMGGWTPELSKQIGHPNG